MSTLEERLSTFRIHKINVAIEYEGIPITKHVKEELARAFGDCLALALRGRSGTADAVYTLGMAQELDTNGEPT